MANAVLPKKYILAGIIAAGSLILVLALFASSHGEHGIAQPLAFNHKAHIDNAGVDCKDCHLNVEKSAVATIPALEVCTTCHSGEPLSKSPVEQELLKYAAEKKEIPWVQIYSLPPHVYFSHRRHVTIGGLECPSCHGNVAVMSAPVSHQETPLKMENCIACHTQRKVTNDCIACHR